MEKPLTRPYSELRRKRIQSDPEFGRLLLLGAVEDFGRGDLVMGCAMLHNYIDGTIGFEKLGKALGKPPKRLKRMLVDDNSIRSEDLSAIIEYLKGVEGVEAKMSWVASKPEGKNSRKSAKESAVA